MSKEPSTDTIESNKANSTVSTATIEDTKSARPRGKVSGKFLRLTMAHNGIPIFVRSDNIGAYHDEIDKKKGFQGCWLTGTSFSFSVKEYAEDIQALIAQVEGEYSAGELAETLIALLVVAGTDPSEARALLSTAPREALVKRINALGERLSSTREIDPLLEENQLLNRKLAGLRFEMSELIHAGKRLYMALGGADTNILNDEPVSRVVRCIDEAIAKLRDAKLRESALLDKGGHIRAMAVKEQVDREKFGQRHEELMKAGDTVLQALGITSEQFDEEAGHGLDDHGAMLRMLTRAVELIGGLKERADNAEVDANHLRRKLLDLQTVKQDAAANLKTCDELSCQLSELEDRLAFTTQARKDGEERAACLEKDADKLRARLADALRQLPEPVQRDLERVWTVREAAGVQS